MDLQNIKPDTQRVDIHHPGTGAATGLVMEVASSESDAVKRVNRKQLDKALRNRSKKLTAADIEANNTERLVAAVVAWEWNGEASWGGDKLEHNKENVSSVIEAAWVRKQIEEVLSDDEGFFSN